MTKDRYDEGYNKGMQNGLLLLGQNVTSVTVPSNIEYIIANGNWYPDWPNAVYACIGPKTGVNWHYSDYAANFQSSLDGNTWSANKTCRVVVGVQNLTILNRIKLALYNTTASGSLSNTATWSAV